MLNFIEKFIRLLMLDGKKIKAYNIFYECISYINLELYKMNLLDLDYAAKADGLSLETPLLRKEESADEMRNTSTAKKNRNIYNTNTTHKLKTYFFFINKKKNIGKNNVALIQKVNFFAKALHVVFCAVDNVKPNLEIRRVRVSGLTYQVPSLLSKEKQNALAIKWIIVSAKERKLQSKESFSKCLSQEIIDAFNKQGQARNKRDELHRLAEANRAYIRYRWW